MSFINPYIQKILDNAGVYQSGVVETRDVVFSVQIRKLCADNRCGMYGKSWSCPPAIGTLDECRERVLSYRRMLVYSGKYDIEDTLDYDGMLEARKAFDALVRRLKAGLAGDYENCAFLSNEGCEGCGTCTYPDLPCRNPDAAGGLIEGYGIDVGALALRAGIRYNNGENTVTYFGAMMYNDCVDGAIQD